MKTVGEILGNARVELGLTPNDISKITKIELKYIKALEKDDYQKLPSTTFVKGFVRNYAQVVGRNPDEMVAVFRRDYSQKVEAPKIALEPKKLNNSFDFSLPKGTVFLILTGIFVFSSYLAFQYRAILVPPPLEIVSPDQKAVLNSPVMIEGITSPDSLVSIGQGLDTRPDADGKFKTTLNLSPGDHNLKIKATNRFNRSTESDVQITVISQ